MKAQPKKQTTQEHEESKSHLVAEHTTITNETKKLVDTARRQAWEQFFKSSGGDITRQIFGTSGFEEQLQEGHAVSLKKQQEEKKPEKVHPSEGHLEYVRRDVMNVERVSETHIERQLSQSMEEIRMEIRKLMKTSKMVERTVKDATVDKAPIKPGKYHLNFFQFVLSVLRDATQKLEDTVHYGAVFTSKKQQSKYWSSYKKQGTTFGLSGERTVATQTG